MFNLNIKIDRYYTLLMFLTMFVLLGLFTAKTLLILKEQTMKPMQTETSTVKSLNKQGLVIAIFRNKDDQKLFDNALALLKVAKELLANLKDADATLNEKGKPYEDIVNLQKAIALMEPAKTQTEKDKP